MKTAEKDSTKRRCKEISKGSLGLMLFTIVLFSFNGGLFVTLGIRHQMADTSSVMFLAVGSFSVLVAVLASAAIFSKARWTADN